MAPRPPFPNQIGPGAALGSGGGYGLSSPTSSALASASASSASPIPPIPPAHSTTPDRTDPSQESLIKRLEPALLQFMAQEFINPIDYEKAQQYASIRRMDLYLRGFQYLTIMGNPFSGVDYVPISGDGMRPSTNTLEGLWDYQMNVILGDLRKFVALVGTRAPYPKAMARDSSNAQHQVRKQIADRIVQFHSSHWNIDFWQQYLAYGLGKAGTMFGLTQWTVDPGKLGHTLIPKIGMEMQKAGPPIFQCPYCGSEFTEAMAREAGMQLGPGGLPSTGIMSHTSIPGMNCPTCTTAIEPAWELERPDIPVPMIIDQVSYPNGAVELGLYHGAHCVYPYWVRPNAGGLDDCPWFILDLERNKGTLVRSFPWLRQHIYMEQTTAGQTSMSTHTGRLTRGILSSPTGQQTVMRDRGLWTHSQAWMQPSQYEYLPGDREGDLRDLLYRNYPNGVKIDRIDNWIVKLTPERLASKWAVCTPEPSETIQSQPYFQPYIEIQDQVNDAINMIYAAMQRMNPLVFFDPEVISAQRLARYNTAQGEFIPASPRLGADLQKSFFRTQAAELDPKVWDVIDRIISMAREISGITPPAFGGGGPEPTAHAAEIKKNQALMQLNMVWTQMRVFWDRVHQNAVYEASRFAIGERLPFVKGSDETADFLEIPGMSDILKGGWYIRCEESTPMNPGQRRDFYMNLLMQPPETHIISGLMVQAADGSLIPNPENLSRMQEAISSPDWKIPLLDMRNAVMDDIQQLMQSQPIMGPDIMGPDGFPMPSMPQASILPDPNLYNPLLVVEVVRGYLNGDEGRPQKGTPGYENCLLYLQAALQMIAPPAPPPGEDGTGGEDGSEGGPESGEEVPDPAAGGQPGPPPKEVPQNSPMTQPPPTH